MQQPQMTVYADISEVRMETRAAECNRLLGEGWVLLGVYPLTTVAEMAAREAGGEGERRQRQDIQRYVRRLVGYVLLVGDGSRFVSQTLVCASIDSIGVVKRYERRSNSAPLLLRLLDWGNSHEPGSTISALVEG